MNNKFLSRAYICFFLLLSAQTACLADVSSKLAGKTVESKATKASLSNRVQDAELFDDGNMAVSKRVKLHPAITQQINQARSGLGGASSGHYIMPGAAFGF